METHAVKTKADWKQFFSLPYSIYKNDPHWVPPLIYDEKRSLNPSVNPFFLHGEYEAWIVSEDHKTLGRILAFVDHKHNEFHQERTGFIGFFECVESDKVANALFEIASMWLKIKGMDRVRGPVNLSVSNECGLLVTGNDRPPYIKMGHSPEYYINLFHSHGFSRVHELLAYLLTEETIKANQKLLSRLERVHRRNLDSDRIVIRPIKMKNYTEEVEHVFRLYNQVMKENWGFVPATREEMRFIAKSLRPVIDPEMVFMVEKDGEIVGCSLSVPNINQILPKLKGRLFPFGIIQFLLSRKQINTIRLMLIGILPEYRERGLEVSMILNTITRGIERGYSAAELSWISEENKNLIGILDKLGADCYKRYEIYEIPLT